MTLRENSRSIVDSLTMDAIARALLCSTTSCATLFWRWWDFALAKKTSSVFKPDAETR